MGKRGGNEDQKQNLQTWRDDVGNTTEEEVEAPDTEAGAMGRC